MKAPHCYLPILIASLFACKSSPNRSSKTQFDPSWPEYKKAQALYYAGNDSAYYYFNKIATDSKDSLQRAMGYNYMGTMQTNAGDYFGGQETLLKSLSLLDERNDSSHYCLAANYHELGRNNHALKYYDAAIRYYDKALTYIKDSAWRIIALNNKAVVYKDKGDYSQAINIYDSIIEPSKRDTQVYARILSNYATVKWLQDNHYDAAPELWKALLIRKNGNNTWGLNASYAHLSNFYTRSRPDSALFYAAKMYTTARSLNSPDDQTEALSKLIPLSRPREAKEYFLRYQQLTDSIQTARTVAKNQFALIRYETEKSKAENLQLQKDNTQKKTQLLLERIIYGLTILTFIGFIKVAILWYKKRQLKIKAETQHAIQESQLKISQKVHDVVANGLYRIMTSVEHQETVDKDQLLDQIEVLYEQSRDISYEHPGTPHLNFHEKIANLLTEFASNDTKVLFMGNSLELWNQASAEAQEAVQHILQELLVNMKKHSQAHNVLVKFEQHGNQVHIQYTDDGVGLPPQFKYGNGLNSTGNRINKIGGDFTFEETTKGVKIRISIPTAATT